MPPTHRNLQKCGVYEIPKSCIRVNLCLMQSSTLQETIFVADGNHDYTTECAKSGEPLIRTMVPSEEEEAAEGYEFEPPYPFVKALVGDPPEHVKAYEVCNVYLDITRHANPLTPICLKLWRLHEEKRELRKSHLDHWQSTVSRTGTGRPIDAIVSPAVAYTAVPHGLNTYFPFHAILMTEADHWCVSR